MAEAVPDKGTAAVETGGSAATTTTSDKGVATATTTAAAPAPAPKSVIEVKVADGGASTTAEPAKGAWPEDWVARVAKGDEKRAKDFSKFASPEALAESYSALQKRFSSGEFRPVLPKDPKPEELAAWRKDNGIPDKPETYDLKGLAIPKEDGEIVAGLLRSAHAVNMTPAQARTAVESFYATQKANEEARDLKDEDQRQAALDTLNQEWGGQFRRNVNLTEGILAKFPESVRESIKSARLPDGTLLFNNVDAVRGFVALSLEMNPAGIVVPASGGDMGKAALDEYRDIQKFMRENRTAYDKDAAKQARFGELIAHLRKNEIIDDNGNEVVTRKAA